MQILHSQNTQNNFYWCNFVICLQEMELVFGHMEDIGQMDGPIEVEVEMVI